MILAQAQSGGSSLFSFLPLILIVVVFYFLMIRPQNKRRREQAQMQSSIEPGTRILTTNGMYATVVEVEDSSIIVEISPGIEARFLKQAVMQVLSDEETGEDEADEETGGDGTTAADSADEPGDAAKDSAGTADSAEEKAGPADSTDEPKSEGLTKSDKTVKKTS